MTEKAIHKILTYCIASVWLINGLCCKVLNLVPRHQQIVSKILGSGNSRLLTIAIGCAEIIIGIWSLSRIYTRCNAITQIIIVVTMNALEFILVPELLLWGRANALFASIFLLVVCFNESFLNSKLRTQN
ncbi:MAG: DoxX-like family protein [Ferruginibacter sp.]